jgi:hypothetical protein
MGNPKHYIPILAALLLLCGLGFASTPSVDQHKAAFVQLVPVRGVVTFSEGKVEIRRQGGDWEALYSADRVRPDDSLRTADDGRAEISWGNPRRVIRVERASAVGLKGAAKGNRLVLVGASVDSGAVWARILDQGRPFALESPTLRADAQEATLSLRVSDEASRLSVYRGDIRVGGREVGAGNGLQVSAQGIEGFEVSAEDDLRDGWCNIVQETFEAAPSQSSPMVTKLLSKDLRDLSPEIYLGVEVELTGRAAAGREFEAGVARIRKIRVRSEKWDNLLPDHKVRLLNETFTVLKERYPVIMETMVLEFDDHRPMLSLKYAAAG